MENRFDALTAKEYLLTNGIGGYCSSSFSGANTRRYHGLLVSSQNPPTDRKVLVSKIEETVLCNNERYELSANQYPATIYPSGHQYIADYGVIGNEAYVHYEQDNVKLKKMLSIADRENTSTIEYTNYSDTTFELRLNPLLVYKDYHSLFTESGQFDFYAETLGNNKLKIFAEYGAIPLFITITQGSWVFDKKWYKNLEYAKEQERGFPYMEDAVSIGLAIIELNPGDQVSISFSTVENCSHKKAVLDLTWSSASKLPAFIIDLERASRQFVVQRKSTGGSTIIAGYHWFTDWGRDTMIALRGISIATGRQDEAKSILETFLQFLDRGMLPNRFPDNQEELEYNTADATLWLFVALYEYQLAFNDPTFISSVLPLLKNILTEHCRGTRYGIQLTEEGLLYAGEDGIQLTWMDAKVNGYVVTPRRGCAVEINLLWYNALKIYLHFNELDKLEKDRDLEELVSLFEHSFPVYFLNENGYLNDVVSPGTQADESIRPNQVYGVSLPFSPLTHSQKTTVLETVEQHLFTDYGLRTLSITHPDFKPIYKGDSWERDNAYHQGTVWPFLWGEWALASLHLHGYTPEICLQVWKASKKLQEHFYGEGCLHAIAEIFDGLHPATGKGCVHQAWSVGMLLRVFLDKRFDYSLISET